MHGRQRFRLISDGTLSAESSARAHLTPCRDCESTLNIHAEHNFAIVFKFNQRANSQRKPSREKRIDSAQTRPRKKEANGKKSITNVYAPVCERRTASNGVRIDRRDLLRLSEIGRPAAHFFRGEQFFFFEENSFANRVPMRFS